MTVVSALRAGRPLLPGTLLVLTSVSGSVEPRAIAQLEGLGQFHNPLTSSVIELSTFQFVA
jgi:hypothetical protein